MSILSLLNPDGSTDDYGKAADEVIALESSLAEVNYALFVDQKEFVHFIFACCRFL